jgi:starch synthase
VTTVSPRYAREIQTPEYGFGFEGIVRSRAADVIGILNGIDHDEWDPARDPHLARPFDASCLDQKQHTKKLVLDSYGLPSDRRALAKPLVGVISRMVDQKGLDIIAQVADALPREGATFVVLGTGEQRYEDLWRSIAQAHPRTVGVKIGFDEGLAHRIEGGADMFLMPSRFEPCGLNQMYSLRYGTVPVVHAVGGLADTVTDFNPSAPEGTGFAFEEYSGMALLGALRRALAAYADKAVWAGLQRRGMALDFSWDASAREYVKVYGRILR